MSRRCGSAGRGRWGRLLLGTLLREGTPAHRLCRFPTGRRLAASAVEAAVVEAGPAAPGKLAPQRLAGTMQPNAGVPRCDTHLLGEAADAEAVEVDAAMRCAVLGLEGIHHRRDAGACYGLELLVGCDRLALSLRGK